LNHENLAIKEIAEHKLRDIGKLKEELGQAIDVNAQLVDEKRQLESQITLQREEKRKLLGELDSTS